MVRQVILPCRGLSLARDGGPLYTVRAALDEPHTQDPDAGAGLLI